MLSPGGWGCSAAAVEERRAAVAALGACGGAAGPQISRAMSFDPEGRRPGAVGDLDVPVDRDRSATTPEDTTGEARDEPAGPDRGEAENEREPDELPGGSHEKAA
jgi:hypothetical protein